MTTMPIENLPNAAYVKRYLARCRGDLPASDDETRTAVVLPKSREFKAVALADDMMVTATVESKVSITKLERLEKPPAPVPQAASLSKLDAFKVQHAADEAVETPRVDNGPTTATPDPAAYRAFLQGIEDAQASAQVDAAPVDSAPAVLAVETPRVDDGPSEATPGPTKYAAFLQEFEDTQASAQVDAAPVDAPPAPAPVDDDEPWRLRCFIEEINEILAIEKMLAAGTPIVKSTPVAFSAKLAAFVAAVPARGSR